MKSDNYNNVRWQIRRFLPICSLAFLLLISSCMGSKLASSANRGGEVTGVGGGKSFAEPTPFGMALVKSLGN